MTKMNAATASARIKELIDQQCGGSQQNFAETCGVRKNSVSQWVNGIAVPGNYSAVKISRVFGIDPLMPMRLILDIKKDPRRSKSLWG